MFAAAFAAAADPVRHIGTVRHTGAPTPWYSACLYSCYPSGCELGWIKIGKARRPKRRSEKRRHLSVNAEQP
jgi:hypothetical protein